MFPLRRVYIWVTPQTAKLVLFVLVSLCDSQKREVPCWFSFDPPQKNGEPPEKNTRGPFFERHGARGLPRLDPEPPGPGPLRARGLRASGGRGGRGSLRAPRAFTGCGSKFKSRGCAGVGLCFRNPLGVILGYTFWSHSQGGPNPKQTRSKAHGSQLPGPNMNCELLCHKWADTFGGSVQVSRCTLGESTRSPEKGGRLGAGFQIWRGWFESPSRWICFLAVSPRIQNPLPDFETLWGGGEVASSEGSSLPVTSN